MPGSKKPPLVSEFAADPEMAELVDLFVTELPGRIAALQQAWSGRQVMDLTRLAHQLKGACAGYGFPAIGTAAGTLEARLRQIGSSSAEAAVRGLSAEFSALVELCDRACGKQ